MSKNENKTEIVQVPFEIPEKAPDFLEASMEDIQDWLNSLPSEIFPVQFKNAKVEEILEARKNLK